MGSLVAQHFHLTSSERKTLLVAGAAAGMSATFATPVAAVLLAVELLLFEWKPRSAIPVACASITAALLRPLFLGNGPLFPVPLHTAHSRRRRARVRAVGACRWRPLVAPDPRRLRRGRRVPPAAGPLDVVAGDRRCRDRPRRSDLSAGPGRGVRRHRCAAARRRRRGIDRRHPDCEVR